MTLLPKSIPIPEVSEEDQDKLWAMWEAASYPNDGFPETESMPMLDLTDDIQWDILFGLEKR
jgi:hypothetical protein